MLRKFNTSLFLGYSFDSFTTKNYILLLFLITHLAILIGLFWGNRDFVAGHVTITILFPLILFISSFIVSIVKISSLGRGQVFLLYSLIAFAFVNNIYSHNFYQTKEQTQSVSKELSNYQTIRDKGLEEGSCIQNAYGWNSGAAYFYTGIKPCSKYFQLNLIISDHQRLMEFKQSLIDYPPAAIIYEIWSGPDLDWEDFEKRYFPYHSVLQNCYSKSVNSDVYFAKFRSDNQQHCLMKFSKI